MYSRKSVGMEPWGTPILTGYSCDDLPSRTTRSRLLLRKEEIRPNIWPEIPWLKFVKKTSMPNPVKSLGYIKCYSSSSPRPVKSPSNSIIYTTVRSSTVDREDLKPYRKSEKGHISLSDQQSCYLQVFQRLDYRPFNEYFEHRW